jgi:hypothetical protein
MANVIDLHISSSIAKRHAPAHHATDGIEANDHARVFIGYVEHMCLRIDRECLWMFSYVQDTDDGKAVGMCDREKCKE